MDYLSTFKPLRTVAFDIIDLDMNLSICQVWRYDYTKLRDVITDNLAECTMLTLHGSEPISTKDFCIKLYNRGKYSAEQSYLTLII